MKDGGGGGGAVVVRQCRSGEEEMISITVAPGAAVCVTAGLSGLSGLRSGGLTADRTGHYFMAGRRRGISSGGGGDNPAGDKRRRDYEPKTKFQKWVKPLLAERGWNYSDLFRELVVGGEDVTENYLYRIVRGDPEKFKNAARPGYDLAVAIGRILGDVGGAIDAADYALPGATPGGRRIPLGGGYELTAPENDPNAQKYAEIFAQVRAMIERGEATDPGEPTEEDFKVAEEIEKEREAGGGSDW